MAKGSSPFAVAWYRSDTAVTINYLSAGTVDVGITYNSAAETIAINQGIAKDPSYYAFRDHFYVTGPKENPANISTSGDIDAKTLFAELFAAATEGRTSDGVPVRFLSRYDKSATNIKESEMWIAVGQVSTLRPLV